MEFLLLDNRVTPGGICHSQMESISWFFAPGKTWEHPVLWPRS